MNARSTPGTKTEISIEKRSKTKKSPQQLFSLFLSFLPPLSPALCQRNQEKADIRSQASHT